MKLPCAFSPCPNDTYLFYAWVHGHVKGQVDGQSITLEPTLADIQTLNSDATQGQFPLTKLSIAAYPTVWEQYQLLPVGMAFSDGEGPRVIGLPGKAKELGLALRGKRIAVPGVHTTAFLALKLLYGEDFIPLFCPYHEVLAQVKSGQADYGLLIHETRTHFAHEGVEQYADLGQVWQQRYALPLPLGGLALKRSLIGSSLSIVQALSDSLSYARSFPENVLSYMMQHSQEQELHVIEKHLSLYVTEETRWVSQRAKEGLLHFFLSGQEKGWWKSPPKEWIWEEEKI